MLDDMLKLGNFGKVYFDELSCSSWGWLGHGPSVPTSITVPTISTELMFPNPNTDAQENKTISTTSEVVWQKTPSGSLQVASVDAFNAYISLGVNALFVGDVMKWTLEKSKNQYCDVAFKVNIRLLQSQFEALLFRSAATPFNAYLDDGQRPYEASVLGSVLSLSPSAFQPGVVFE